MKRFALAVFTATVLIAPKVSADDRPLAAELATKTKAGAGKAAPATAKTMDDATNMLRKSGIVDKAPKVGTQLPNFELPDATGKIIRSQDLLSKGPLVVTFYRGSWCPYCNIQLRAYEKVIGEFNKRGASLVAITPATPDDTLTTKQKHQIEFPVLSDNHNTYARQLGIVFHVPDALRQVYQGFGIDLAKNQGNDAWDLPLPATFVVDRSGKILWSFVDVDYKKRAEPKDILAALDALKI